MLKLYTIPGACSTGCHIALYWCKADFDFEIVDHDGLKKDEFLKLNPSGQVPVLVDDRFVLTENVAIMNYIADSFPQGKLLGDGSKQQRAEALRWLAFVNSDIHPVFGLIFGGQQISGDQKVIEILDTAARKKLHKLYGQVDKQLAEKEWIAGFRSVADPYLFMTLTWVQNLKIDILSYKNLLQFYMKMQKDDGVLAVFKAEGIPNFV
ncbi:MULTISPECIES: glutathione S-transferase family protein [unclassified Commensalibacter]|uniref:glutathione S-transferase family protein n=1 Tax=unclassified Commensalibacter TaxID=2630218 RepID=UPI0018DB2A6E|nr:MULTISPECIES: glutathione S-transferase N-terminal domain-containing protein [unclassified Commensalibacter]MBI0017164.1 glutathione S-transferase N-terminal domain-containing protein [Commensalibacter sp. B14384M2]MBI0049540.1 glutathione S-transferase N-terminal domain-containing protein [Commensalibacter sp. B14384M3]MBI0179598.1 glutathione S-transferase N-terminal domain-containing protein [Commensalibacter sp. W8163]